MELKPTIRLLRKMKSCLNCLYCKNSACSTELRCKKRHWIKFDGSEKIVRKNRLEILNGKIGARKFFEDAEYCLDFEDMDG